MAGYGIRDGGYIVNAVSDYANYVESRRRYEQDRADRLSRERQATERQARIDAMDREAHEAQMAEYKRTAARQTMLDKRSGEVHDANMQEHKEKREREEAVRKARRGIADLQTQGIDAAERAELAPLEREAERAKTDDWIANRIMSYGASGKGVSIQYDKDPNEQGVYLAKNVDAEGNSKQLTWDPFDDNSSPIRVREADIPMLETHVRNAVKGASDLPEDKQAAYGRSALAPNEDGTARPSTVEEFSNGVKNWLARGAKAAPKIAGAVMGAQPSGVVSALGEWWGGASEETKKTTEVTEDGLLIKSGKVDLETLKNVRAEIDAAGVDVGSQFDKNPVMRSLQTSQRIQEIQDRYASKRTRMKHYGDMYVNGRLNDEQFQNLVDTGNPNVSQLTLDKFAHEQNVDAAVAHQRGQNYMLNLRKFQAAQAKGDREAAAKARKEADKKAGEIATAAVAAAYPGMKVSQREGVAVGVKQAIDKTLAATGMADSELLTLFGGVTLQDAAIRYAKNTSDYQTASLTPYLVSSMAGFAQGSDEDNELQDVLGKLKWDEAGKLRVASAMYNSGVPPTEFADKLMRASAAGYSADDVITHLRGQ